MVDRGSTADAGFELVTTDLYIIDGHGTHERRLFAEQRKRLFPVDPDASSPRSPAATSCPTRCCSAGRSSIASGCSTRTCGVAEDYELWIRFLVGGVRAVYIDEPLGYYRIRAGSYIRTGEPAARHLAVLEEYLPKLWKLGARGNASDAYMIGTQLAAAGDRRAALPVLPARAHRRGRRGRRASSTH